LCFIPSGAESDGSIEEREDLEDSRPATREPEVETVQGLKLFRVNCNVLYD